MSGAEPRRLGPVAGRLSQAVVNLGIVTTSGQVADAPAGLTVEEETRAILSKINAVLAEAGTARSYLLSATVYLADMAAAAAMNSAWEAWIDPAALPARTTIQTPMTRPEWRVATSVIAWIPAGRP